MNWHWCCVTQQSTRVWFSRVHAVNCSLCPGLSCVSFKDLDDACMRAEAVKWASGSYGLALLKT
jgi:hypothetical protein